jgi:hypothetical protein
MGGTLEALDGERGVCGWVVAISVSLSRAGRATITKKLAHLLSCLFRDVPWVYKEGFSPVDGFTPYYTAYRQYLW